MGKKTEEREKAKQQARQAEQILAHKRETDWGLSAKKKKKKSNTPKCSDPKTAKTENKTCQGNFLFSHLIPLLTAFQ